MSKGGFRFGAGRPGWRRKCEHLLHLDIRILARGGRLRPKTYWNWRWTLGGEPSGDITTVTTNDQVRFLYSVTPDGGTRQAMDYTAWIDRTPCRYGGSRPWFRCPRCGRRRAVLYGVASDGQFGCRGCLRLGYASEAEDALDRLYRRRRKLESRLDEDRRKPKWMRWRTYTKARTKLDHLEQRIDHAFCLKAMAILRLNGLAKLSQ